MNSYCNSSNTLYTVNHNQEFYLEIQHLGLPKSNILRLFVALKPNKKVVENIFMTLLGFFLKQRIRQCNVKLNKFYLKPKSTFKSH